MRKAARQGEKSTDQGKHARSRQARVEAEHSLSDLSCCSPASFARSKVMRCTFFLSLRSHVAESLEDLTSKQKRNSLVATVPCLEFVGGAVDGGAHVVEHAVSGQRHATVLDSLRNLVHVHEEVGQALVECRRAQRLLNLVVPLAGGILVLREELLEDARDVALLIHPRLGVGIRGF